MPSEKTTKSAAVLKRMKRLAENCVLSFVFFCTVAAAASGSTLSTNYADVQVENLQIGGSYNLTEQAQCPMWIGYDGQQEIKVRVSVEVPSAAELRKGFEPIPDASWVKVSRSEIVMLKDEGTNIDVTITVPKDEKYLGKKFQAWLRINSVPSSSSGAVAVSLALKGRVRFSVAAKPPTEAELKELRKKAARAAQGVSLTPERFEAGIPEQGGRVEVTEDTPLKCINSSSEKYTIAFSAVEPAPYGITIPAEYVAGDPREVTLDRKKIAVGPDAIGSVKIFIEPKGKEGRKALYVVKVDIHSETKDVVKFVKIYAVKN